MSATVLTVVGVSAEVVANSAISNVYFSKSDTPQGFTAPSNPYKFSVHRNAAANTGNGVFVKIDFDTEAFDTNNNFASGTYTAPVSGFYQFNARASCAVTTQFLLAIYVNGSVVKRGTHVLGNGTVGCDLSVLLQLSATNTVEIHSLGNGGALEVATGVNVWFTGHLVSRT